MFRRLLTFVLVGGVALATTVLPALAAGKSHDVKTEIVSVDAEHKTLTIKDDKGASMTVKVLDAAVASLKSVKAGDKVMLTCQDNDKGEHEGVVAIKMQSPEKKG